MARTGWLIEVTTTEAGDGDTFIRHVVAEAEDWFEACRAAATLDPRGFLLSPVRRVDEEELERLQVPVGGAAIIADT